MSFFNELFEIIESRKTDQPPNSYVASLFEDKEELFKKINEETLELILAMEDEKNVIHEASDLIFHVLVAVSSSNHSLEEVEEELRSRHVPRE